MRVDVTLPSLGDDDDAVTGGEVSQWLVDAGHTLQPGDDLLELTTDKAAFVVPSPLGGEVVELRAKVGDQIEVGQIVCVLEDGDPG